MKKISQRTAYKLALENSLWNIPFLKHLELLKAGVTCFLLEPTNCLALQYLPDQIPYDQQIYNSCSSISIIANDDIASIEKYIGLLGGGNHIIKTGSQIQYPPVSRLRSFTNLTTDKIISVESSFRILISRSVDARFQDLLDTVAHSADEMNHLIGDKGRVFYIEEKAIPVSCCVVYPNFANIWEIGAVATLETQRRNGFAKALVAQASNYLLSHDCLPRYNVNSENQGSLQLALSCGYAKFLELIHYQVEL